MTLKIYTSMLKLIKILILILLILIARVFFDELRFYNEAEKYFNENKILIAIDYYELAINQYLPFSPIVKKATLNLLKIGENFEKKGKYKEALYALENLRSAFLQARSFYTPNKNLIKELNYKIANIKTLILQKKLKCNNYNTCFKKELENLNSFNSEVSTFWSFISCIFFLLWIFSVLLLIFNLKSIKLFYLILLNISTFLLWLITLYLT